MRIAPTTGRVDRGVRPVNALRCGGAAGVSFLDFDLGFFDEVAARVEPGTNPF